MSIKAMSYVWDTKHKGSLKLLLLAVADRCNDEGVCFPGVDRLAKKASITKRQAQKQLAQLEELGELTVLEGEGVKTAHGCTNRYYMKKYRATLDLTTPEGRRGVENDTPGVSKMTPQGVSKMTPQGVSKMTPNTSVYTSEETSGNSVPPSEDYTPPAYQYITGERKPFTMLVNSGQQYRDGSYVDPLTFPSEVTNLFYAWVDALQSVNRLPLQDETDLWRKNLREFQALALSKIDPRQLYEYIVSCIMGDPFWRDKNLGAMMPDYISKNLPGWLAARRSPTPPAAQQDAPANQPEWRPMTEDEAEAMRQLREKFPNLKRRGQS